MAGALVIPICSASPQGGGVCAYTATDGGTLPNLGVSESGEYQNYKYTATPAAGATFLGFDVTTSGYSRQSPTAPAEPYTYTSRKAGTQVGASWEYAPSIANWRTEWFEAGYAIWNGVNYSQNLDLEVQSISVVAVFSVPHVPTHLPVCSANELSPVRLVYDDVNGTDALVADY